MCNVKCLYMMSQSYSYNMPRSLTFMKFGFSKNWLTLSFTKISIYFKAVSNIKTIANLMPHSLRFNQYTVRTLFGSNKLNTYTSFSFIKQSTKIYVINNKWTTNNTPIAVRSFALTRPHVFEPRNFKILSNCVFIMCIVYMHSTIYILRKHI